MSSLAGSRGSSWLCTRPAKVSAPMKPVFSGSSCCGGGAAGQWLRGASDWQAGSWDPGWSQILGLPLLSSPGYPPPYLMLHPPVLKRVGPSENAHPPTLLSFKADQQFSGLGIGPQGVLGRGLGATIAPAPLASGGPPTLGSVTESAASTLRTCSWMSCSRELLSIEPGRGPGSAEAGRGCSAESSAPPRPARSACSVQPAQLSDRVTEPRTRRSCAHAPHTYTQGSHRTTQRTVPAEYRSRAERFRSSSHEVATSKNFYCCERPFRLPIQSSLTRGSARTRTSPPGSLPRTPCCP